MFSIPTSIEINGTSYAIRNNGDFRMVLDVFSALNDIELEEKERIACALIIFYSDINDLVDLNQIDGDLIEELVKQMFWWMNCGQPESLGAQPHKLIDWDSDSQIICAAVNKVANTEIRSMQYLHWWTFMGYFSEVGESTLSTVVSIRNKIVKGKKLEKYENEFRRNNPQYFNWNSKTAQEREEDELIKELWNGGMNNG